MEQTAHLVAQQQAARVRMNERARTLGCPKAYAPQLLDNGSSIKRSDRRVASAELSWLERSGDCHERFIVLDVDGGACGRKTRRQSEGKERRGALEVAQLPSCEAAAQPLGHAR